MTTIVLVIEALLIVAHVSVPFARNLSLTNRASAIVREMTAVRAAAESARGTSGAWPADEAPGQVPEALKAYLPASFSFTQRDHELDWESFTLGEDSEIEPRFHELAGVSVVAEDPLLAAAVARQLGAGETRFTLGNRTTLVIAEPSAATP